MASRRTCGSRTIGKAFRRCARSGSRAASLLKTPRACFPYGYTCGRAPAAEPPAEPSQGGARVEKERATGRDVILAVVENMHQSLEPLVTETVAPSLYRVYLHDGDYEHLRTLFGKIENEAKKVLDQELERLNKDSVPVLQRLLRRKNGGSEPPMRYVSAESGWYIRFQEDPNGTLTPGDIEVVSEFAQPVVQGYGAGSKMRRISTTRRLGQTVSRRELTDSLPAYARLSYQDKRGPQTYLMAKDEIVIGREAPDVWVDLRLDTLPDVSREHA